MPNPHPPYPPEFRAEAVRLYRESGKGLAAVSKDLGVSLESLRKWVSQAKIDAGEAAGLTTEEREELRRLRRENRTLRMERDLLKPPPSSHGRARPREHLPVHRCGAGHLRGAAAVPTPERVDLGLLRLGTSATVSSRTAAAA